MQLEHKLALIHQMRQENTLNEKRMGIKERTYEYKRGDLYMNSSIPEQVSLFSSSFRLRFLLALLIFLLFFVIDIQNISLGSVNSTNIQSHVEWDMTLDSLPFLVDDIN